MGIRALPPVYLVAIAVLCGDAVGVEGRVAHIAALATFALCAVALYIYDQKAPGLAVALIGIFLASTIPASGLFARRLPSDISHLPEGQEVEFTGTLIREVEHYKDRQRLYLDVEKAEPRDGTAKPAEGILRLTVMEPGDFHLGQRVAVTTKLRLPRNYGDPGEFDYRSEMARERIAATAFVEGADEIEVLGDQRRFPASIVEAARRHIGDFVDAHLEYPEREEMRALVIGDRGGIDDQLRNEFALTGMAHLLVISGLHLGFVASAAFGLMRLVLGFFPLLMIRGWANKISAAFASVAVIAYASIAGHHVSTIRALIMVLTYMTAVILDRPRQVVAALSLAAIIICVTLPGSTADIGFQLSFASVLGIVLGMRCYERWWTAFQDRRLLRARSTWPMWRIAGALGAYVAVSFWALAGTAALTAYYFNQFSIVGLVANAVVVPIMGGLGMVSGLAAALLSFASNLPAVLLLHFAGFCLGIGTWLAR